MIGYMMAIMANTIYMNGCGTIETKTVKLNYNDSIKDEPIIIPGDKLLSKDLSVDEQYTFALNFLKIKNYSMAEKAFKEFVSTYPDHELAGNAQYWYADTFFVRKLFTDAVNAFESYLKKYPKGTKAPLSLLKLVMSIAINGQLEEGCKMINNIELEYPDADKNVINFAKYVSEINNCTK